jgi:hypothetical protein
MTDSRGRAEEAAIRAVGRWVGFDAVDEASKYATIFLIRSCLSGAEVLRWLGGRKRWCCWDPDESRKSDRRREGISA